VYYVIETAAPAGSGKGGKSTKGGSTARSAKGASTIASKKGKATGTA